MDAWTSAAKVDAIRLYFKLLLKASGVC